MKKDKKIMAMLAMKNGFEALIGAGYSASALIGAGYSLSDLRGAGYSLSDLRGAGYSASALIGAGYSASALRGAGYSASDLRGAGYSASDLRGAGYSASALIGAGYSASALRSAGYSASDLELELKKFPEWDSIVPLVKPYTAIWNDIQAGKRKFDQRNFGPSRPIDEKHLCNTAMCTAGNICQLSGRYDLVEKYGHSIAASLIHQKSCPDLPEQNYGSIPDEFALAYIEEMKDREDLKI